MTIRDKGCGKWSCKAERKEEEHRRFMDVAEKDMQDSWCDRGEEAGDRVRSRLKTEEV